MSRKRRRRRTRIAALGLLAVVAAATLGTYHVFGPEDDVVRATEPEPAAPGQKRILLYNTYFGNEDWEFGLGHGPFANQCPASGANCHVSYYGHSSSRDIPASAYDAVAFHMHNLGYRDGDPPPALDRSPRQRYVLFNKESPVNTREFPFEEYNGYFNWTWTYREDSDVFEPYGAIVPRGNASADKWIPFNTGEFAQKLLLNPESLRRVARKKTGGQVVWAVSNCHSTSAREEYVDRLKIHIQVDVLGKCSLTSCDDNCYRDAMEGHRFYLAFENSLCDGYATEKFWNAMAMDIVPVVLGQAQYSKVAPPHSYIDVNDHASPEDLADYLKRLSSNDTEYLSYFWWKDHYEVTRPQGLCSLCQMLNSEEDNGNTTKVYSDLRKWWEAGGNCKLVKQVPNTLRKVALFLGRVWARLRGLLQ